MTLLGIEEHDITVNVMKAQKKKRLRAWFSECRISACVGTRPVFVPSDYGVSALKRMSLVAPELDADRRTSFEYWRQN